VAKAATLPAHEQVEFAEDDEGATWYKLGNKPWAKAPGGGDPAALGELPTNALGAAIAAPGVLAKRAMHRSFPGYFGNDVNDWEALNTQLHEQHPVATTVGQALPFVGLGAVSGGVLPAIGTGALASYETAKAGEEWKDAALSAALGVGGSAVGHMAGRFLAQNPFASRVVRYIRGVGGVKRAEQRALREELEASGRAATAQAEEEASLLGKPGGGVMANAKPVEAYSDTAKQTLEEAERLGYRVPDPLRSGSAEEAQAFASARSHPGTANDIQRNYDLPNQKLISAQVGRAIGVKDARDLGPAVMKKAEARFNKLYDDVVDRIGPSDGGQLLDKWRQVAGGPEFYGDPGARLVFAGRMRELERALKESGGVMSPEALKGLRSQLAASAAGARPDQVAAYRAMLEATTEHISTVGGKDTARLLAQLNQEYSVFATLKGSRAIKSGMVKPGQLAAALERSDVNAWHGLKEGLNPERTKLYTLLKAHQVLEPALPPTGVRLQTGIGKIANAIGYIPGMAKTGEKAAQAAADAAERLKWLPKPRPPRKP
jgi:hypothetical protein